MTSPPARVLFLTRRDTGHPEAGGDRGGRPVSTRKAAAEQIREAEESKDARRAKASNRDRMVDIGRGNQQAGRQGQ